MTRLPTLRPQQFVAALKKAGFLEHHQKGSHLTSVHPSGRRTVVAIHRRDLKRGLVAGILKDAGLNQDEFLELL